MQLNNINTESLNIKVSDSEYIITINKNQLNSSYILNLVNWLQFASETPEQIGNYLQMLKKVKTKSIEDKRKWNFAGKANLQPNIDILNLRDLAYD